MKMSKKILKILMIFTLVLTFIFVNIRTKVNAYTLNIEEDEQELFIEETIKIFGNVEINSIEYLYNFNDSPDYVYVDFEGLGYVIYYRTTLEMMEYSYEFDLDYSNIDSRKYYAGPSNYYGKKNNKFIDVDTGDYLNLSDSDIELYANNLSNFFSVDADERLNYFLNLNVDIDNSSKEIQVVKNLISRNIIRTKFVKKIEHPHTNNVEFMLRRCLNDITLQVTKDCNFQCRYCSFTSLDDIQRKHEKKTMTFDVAKKSIDFLYNNSKDVNIISIAFYGGEPLLNYELIKQVVEYAKNKFFTKRINFNMTINGSLLKDEIIDFLIKNNFKIAISLDGPKKIQNLHRKFGINGRGTFDKVFENVKKIFNTNKNYFYNNVSFMPVVIEGENYEVIKEFFLQNNINESQIFPLRANLNGIDYTINNHLYDIEHNISVKYDELDQSINNNMINILKNKNIIPSIWHHNGQCIPGIKRLFVDVNGKLFPCEKVLEKDNLSIGTLDTGIDISKVKEMMNIGKITENECQYCWAMRFCDMCVSFCYDVDKNNITKKQKKLGCEMQHQRAINFLKKYLNEHKKK